MNTEAFTIQPEFLTVEQFAQRLQVSRATIFAWMQRGIFTRGRHFFKRGHILRFIWSGALIQELLENSGEGTEKRSPVNSSAVPIHNKKASPINWEY